MKYAKVILATIVVLFLSLPARAADAPDRNWGQWRGPLCTGVAPAGNPPAQWSETQNIRWKVKTPGHGTASPIVWGDRVFISTAIPTGKTGPLPASMPSTGPSGRAGGGFMRIERTSEIHHFSLVCLDRKTGKTLWQTVCREEVPHEGHHPDGSYASNSPVTDGEHVWAFFGSRGLHCLDMDGHIVWQKDLGRMQIKMSFGEGSSPALAGNAIIVNWDHEGDDFVAAFDKATGKELWRTPRDESTSWATPMVVRHGNQTQVIISASGRIRAYDLANGKPIWECAGMTSNVIPTPVSADGIVYATSGFRGNALLAIKLGRDGDLTDTDAIAWRLRKSTPYVPSPLLYGDKLYLLTGNNNVLSCYDPAGGKPVFESQRLDGVEGVYASPVGAADRVYVAGRNGATVVVRRADKFEVIGTNRLDEHFDSSPAVAGDELFLRGKEWLYCIGG